VILDSFRAKQRLGDAAPLRSRKLRLSTAKFVFAAVAGYWAHEFLDLKRRQRRGTGHGDQLAFVGF
jgi:hypothetical protein